LQRIGIFGGTFDPIHYGHLVLAEGARYECGLDRVIFVPAARPPHKEGESVLPGDYRYEMVSLAIEDNPYFEISPLELQRPGYSYTVDTIRWFLAKYPGVSLSFILGMDALLEIKTWKEAAELVRLCGFIAAVRPGYQVVEGDERLQGLPAEFWSNLHIIEVPGLDISSTDLRHRFATGKPVRYLLPPVVEAYIRRQNLYRGDNVAGE